jgi:hypothetical protein
MRFLTAFTLVAALALVGAGCTNSSDEGNDQMEEGAEEVSVLGYDEGVERTYVGEAQGTSAMVYSGQEMIEGTYAYDANLGAICFELSAEEAVKLPGAEGGELELYCVFSGAEMIVGEGELTTIAGEGKFRIGRIEVSEIGGAMLWQIEVLEVVPEEVEEEMESEEGEVDEGSSEVEIEVTEVEVEVVE